MNRNLLKALAEMEPGDDRPGVKPLTVQDIREWAEGDGGLPAVSARPIRQVAGRGLLRLQRRRRQHERGCTEGRAGPLDRRSLSTTAGREP